MNADVSLEHGVVDDVGTVCKSVKRLGKKMAVIVTSFETGLTVSEMETETIVLCTLNQMLPTSPLVVGAAGKRCMQTI